MYNFHHREHIDFVEIGTPLSCKTYLGQPNGDFYGINHMKQRFDPNINAILRSETEVKRNEGKRSLTSHKLEPTPV